MKTVLLPVKDFQSAKQRLVNALAPPHRAGLARAMLMDVLDALTNAKVPDRLIVFTASDQVASVVRPYGLDLVQEVNVRGHSAAVNQMVEELTPVTSHILSLASDLPTISADDVDSMFSISSSDVNLVSSRDGTGTNAVLFASPARIRMEYGEGSLKRHLSNAASAGLTAEVLRIPGIEFDIDTSDDLHLFRQSNQSASHTWRFLSAL